MVQVDGKTRKPRYTAEFFAYKHFCHFIAPGDEMVAYAGRNYSKTPVVVYKKKPKGGKSVPSYIVVAGNFTDKPALLNVRLHGKYLNIEAAPHSFNTYLVGIDK